MSEGMDVTILGAEPGSQRSMREDGAEGQRGRKGEVLRALGLVLLMFPEPGQVGSVLVHWNGIQTSERFETNWEEMF